MLEDSFVPHLLGGPVEFHAADKGHIPAVDMAVFAQIVAVINETPDLVFDPNDKTLEPGKNQVNCYLLTRALAHYFPVWIKDGAFFYYDHSWLLSPSRKSIIDVYPVAAAAAFIVDADSMWSSVYKTQLNKQFNTPEFLRRAELTRLAVGKSVEKLGIKSRTLS